MPRFLVIEGKGIGTSLCQQLRREYYINAEEYIPKDGKAERAVSVSPAMKLGMLYVNKSIPILDEFYKEIVTFPFGRHDDMVDALVQGLIALENFRYLINLPRNF